MAKNSKASKRRRKNFSKKNRGKRATQSMAYEPLEPKHLLAALTVGNATDLSNADTSSITALIANDGGDGISLREAIAAANNTTGLDTITFDPSVFTGGDNSLIRLTQGQLLINDSLTIEGTSAGDVVITGDAAGDDQTVGTTNITDVSTSFGGTAGAADDLLDDNSRVISVSGTANLTLTDLTITGGRTTGRVEGGAGIRFSSNSSGTLTLYDSTLSGNSTTGRSADGGGIYHRSGDVSLVNSTVSGNSASGFGAGGGGIFTRSGAVSLVNSTVSDNSTSGRYGGGGGISVSSSGTVSLVDSTLSGNSTNGYRGDGGGIHILYGHSGSVSLVNSTLSGNSTNGLSSSGGGIATGGRGGVSLVNSTLSGNSTNDNNTSSPPPYYVYISAGGGISTSSGDVSLVNSTLSGNSTNARYSSGGGISTITGDVSLVNSTLSGNSTSGGNSYGGGINARLGDVSLVNSTLSGNSTNGAFSSGGGIYADGGNITLVNSTLSGNSTTGQSSDGGGIWSDDGMVLIVNSTVTGNSASGVGGGTSFLTDDFNDTSELTLRNSIVAGNTDNGTAPDVEAVLTGNLIVENSLIGDTTGSRITTATGTGNILNQDPLLGPLADNGGSTQTHALLPNSPAIDGGSNALALDENGNPLTTDQRGEARIQSGTVDIGAFESEESFLLGDADLNGVINFQDIPAFIDVLISGTFLDEADVNRDGIVDFADIPAFIDVLIGGTFLDEADIDRNGVVDFSDIPPFIDVLAGGSSAVTSQPIVVTSPVSSAASLVSVTESESIASVAATVEVPLTTETSDGIAESAELAELVEYDSPEPVVATDPTGIVPLPKNIPDQLAATEPTSIEASQLSTVASLPSVVAPQFNPNTNNLPSAPVPASAVYRLSERQPPSSSTPLSLGGGLAGVQSGAYNSQVVANDSEPDQQETEVSDLLDETFATDADEFDVVFL